MAATLTKLLSVDFIFVVFMREVMAMSIVFSYSLVVSSILTIKIAVSLFS